MISVLTLTYQRHNLLEEAINSFLIQDFSGESEMLVINDSADVEYVLDEPRVKIFNLKNRFSSIGSKLRWGFDRCKYSHVYRLDDDDLLTPWALSSSYDDIINNPGYDVYRSRGHYLHTNYKFINFSSSYNNGNIYSKDYLNRISIPDKSFGEDCDITFGFNSRVYESDKKNHTMIYRWGMNTYHISGMGDIPTADALDRISKLNNESGIIKLTPKFTIDPYADIPRL